MPPDRPACTPAAPSRRSRGIVSQMEKGGDHFFPPKLESWPSVGRSSVINSALRVTVFIYFFFGGEVCNQRKWICQTYQTPFMCIKIWDPPSPKHLPESVALPANAHWLELPVWCSMHIHVCLVCCPSSSAFRHSWHQFSPLHRAEKLICFRFHSRAP